MSGRNGNMDPSVRWDDEPDLRPRNLHNESRTP
jgi:hypothetical protein